MRGESIGMRAYRAGMAAAATATPATPPRSPYSRPSTTCWRTRCPGSAPTAVRTATSCARPAARATNRPLTFTHPEQEEQHRCRRDAGELGSELPDLGLAQMPHADTRVAIRGGILLRQPAGDGIHIGLRLRDGHIGPPAGDHAVGVQVSPFPPDFRDGVAAHERHPHLGAIGIVEPWRQHANHLVRAAADLDLPADDIRRAAECVPPQSVPQHDLAEVASVHVLVVAKRTAQDRQAWVRARE